jgi:hypothetical protein
MDNKGANDRNATLQTLNEFKNKYCHAREIYGNHHVQTVTAPSHTHVQRNRAPLSSGAERQVREADYSTS